MSTSNDDVEAIRKGIAEAAAREQEGRIEQALQLADQAYTAAQGLNDRGLQVQALVQKARALDGRQTASARIEAEGLYHQALDMATADGDTLHVAVVWRRLALLAVRMDSATDEALARCEKHAAAVARLSDAALEQARGHHLSCEIDYRNARYADAERSARLAISLLANTPEQEQALASAQQLDLSRYRVALAKSLEAQGRIDDAIELYERAWRPAGDPLPLSHDDTVTLQMNHGLALKKRGKLSRARTMLETALRSISADRGLTLDAGIIHTFLSDVCYTDGKADDAAYHGNAARQIYEAVEAPDHRMAEAYTNIANAEMKRKNFAAALVWYEKAIELRRRSLGGDHYQLGVNEGSLAEALVGLSRYDEAMDHVLNARKILEHRTYNPESQQWILAVHGRVLDGLQRGA